MWELDGRKSNSYNRKPFSFQCFILLYLQAVKAKNPLESELAFSTELIRRNFSNYSAWHYRTIILPRMYPDAIPEAQIKEDFGFVINAIAADVDDQSAWFYSQFLIDQMKKAGYSNLIEKLSESIKEFVETDPDSEWVLYAVVKMILMKDQDLTVEEKEFVQGSLHKLIKNDPLRKGCYESLFHQFRERNVGAGDS